MRKILRSRRRKLLGVIPANRLLAWGSLLVTILIWGTYLVSTRAAMTAHLSPIDVGILRSVPAALVLLPLFWRKGLRPGGASWKDILLIGGLGGTVFTLLLASGYNFAPTVDGGIFTPSMLPVFVAVLSLLFLGRRTGVVQLFGIVLIVTGALGIGGYEAISNTTSGAWRGHILFLTASCCWSAYTVRFGVSGLSSLHGAMILLGWSALGFTGLALVFGTGLWSIPTPVLLLQLFQGFMAGFVANFTFLYAVRAFGPAVPAAGAALVPVLAAIGGWVFLGEPITPLKWVGIGVVACGVALASGVLSQRRKT